MKYLMVGSSLRGMADAARLALDECAEVVTFDQQSSEIPEDLRGRVTVLDTQWQSESLHRVDRVITSPWFSELQSPIRDALEAQIDIVTEAGFGLEHMSIPFVGVTGTNGKTTVVEVISDMLIASDVNAVVAGNVGIPVSGLVGTDAEILVVELSSYQLRFLGARVPRAAALLNIAPDHLDWHGDFDAYTAAKARIFEGMEPNSVLAYNVDDPTVVGAIDGAECMLIPCSGERVPIGGNGVDGDVIIVNGMRFEAPTGDVSFRFDLVVAATLAVACGATPEGLARTIESFEPGAHRREIVESSDGIVWVDDSKATNPHATVAAVRSCAPVILLAGGRNKGLDLSPIGQVDGTTHLVLFGESGSDIAVGATSATTVVPSLAEAVDVARHLARPGDTVLLSPGCASFDEFDSFAERGDVFQRLVKQYEGTAA